MSTKSTGGEGEPEDPRMRLGRDAASVKTFVVTIEFACDRLEAYETKTEQVFHAIAHYQNKDYHNAKVSVRKEK